MRQAIAIGLLLLGISVLIHHYLIHGRLVDSENLRCHEFVAGLLIAFAGGLLL